MSNAAMTDHAARVALLVFARERGVTISRTDRAHASDMTFSALGALCTGYRELNVARRGDLGQGKRVDVDTLRHEIVHALTDGAGPKSWEGVDPAFCALDRRLARMVGGTEALLREVHRHVQDCYAGYDPHSARSYAKAQRWAARHKARIARLSATPEQS